MLQPKSLSHIHNHYSSSVAGKGNTNLSLRLPSEQAKALANLSVNCVEEQDVVLLLGGQRKKNNSCSLQFYFLSPGWDQRTYLFLYIQILKYLIPMQVWERICTKTSMARSFHLTSWVTSSSSPCLVSLKTMLYLAPELADAWSHQRFNLLESKRTNK